MNKIAITSLLLCAAFTTWSAKASDMPGGTYQAAARAQTESAPSQRNFVKKYQRSADEYALHTFTTPVPFPQLPVYTGQAKLVTGGLHPNVIGGPTYFMRFKAQEDNKTVLTWYRDLFKQNGWVIDTAMTTNNSIAASNSTATCQITTVSLGTKGYRTEFLLDYKCFHS